MESTESPTPLLGADVLSLETPPSLSVLETYVTRRIRLLTDLQMRTCPGSEGVPTGPSAPCTFEI